MKTLEEFAERAAGGKIFSAVFIKRTTGEERKMLCRMGVFKHAAGGALAYDPTKLKLLPVYDLQAEGYRQIALDGLRSVKIEGFTYTWNGECFEAVES